MERIIIKGGIPLSGTISIGGAKNSAVALIPAALLADGVCTIKNVPNITDRDALFEIVQLLNCNIEQNDKTIRIDSRNLENKIISQELSTKLRASYYFMGVLLGKYKHVEMYFPGGCNIGTRPIDLHLKGFKALGAKITKNKHKYTISADELKGATINLTFASVGATINIMFAAVKAKGTTIINNAAKEVEIINIADFLNKMGAKITGAGTETITIDGVERLEGTEIEVIPDRIEAGTYILMGALLGNNLKVEGIIPEHNRALFEKLEEMGVDFKIDGNSVILNKTDELKPTNVTTLVYPGFPTDLGQPMSVLLTQANGTCVMEETIWENRVGHYPYLQKMGANIELDGLVATIKGKTKLIGTNINATDLRGGAALILAGLIAEGTTIIYDIDYILRGYENIINKLSNVGAKINIEEI
ncbi:MAG: UDP-N-acetylglucosamine 1-carboxyvinyltransferase [Firmicutes bacterium]|nr:UDP-N-acetylglucosamine 1-carboxyvinyltransferase [Bacillota bacterium]